MQTTPNVKLISHTPDPEKIIATAAKLCYSSSDVDSLMEGLTDEKVKSFLELLFDLGHESPIEHATFTFAIEGISRACYDKDTKVLTKNGWKLFKDVDIEKDLICTIDDCNNLTYIKAIDKIAHPHVGKMHYYKSSQIDLMVTPDHNMWVFDHDKRSKETRVSKFLKSEDLVNCRYGFFKGANISEFGNGISEINIPTVYRKHHDPFVGHVYTEFEIPLFLELLGLWITDGSVSYGTIKNGVRISGNRIQISQTKPHVRDRIEQLLTMLNIRFTLSNTDFRISDQALFDWLCANFINGKDTHKSYYIRLPRWIFTDLNRYQKDCLLRGIFLGNGSSHIYSVEQLKDMTMFGETASGGINIYTASEGFADDLVELALLTGRCGNKRYVPPRKRDFPNGYSTICKEQYVVSILQDTYHILKPKNHRSEIDYDDMVYCLTLPKYHRLYVMRNGRTCWCGNCSHQLVRHRIASYSQKSQRYVNEGGFDYIIPPSIAKHSYLRGKFEAVMQQLQDDYDWIRKCLTAEIANDEGIDKKAAEKRANEDARFLLPNACETKIIVTMNIRSLFNFFKERCCNRAQWEIREMAMQMWHLCMEVSPLIFQHAGPECITKGKCPEGKMSCGKPPIMCHGERSHPSPDKLNTLENKNYE